MRTVVAKCLAFAWDSVECKGYEPNRGPLPDGCYEIDADSQLSTLTTIRGLWLFQYPGHEGKATEKPKLVVSQAVAQTTERPKRTMSDALKKKMAAGRAARKAAREASVAA